MKERTLTMSEKELTKLELIKKMEAKELKQKDVAKYLGISPRQVRRLKRRYKAEGARGLVSKKRGRQSNHKISFELKEEVLGLMSSSYINFGPTLLSEKLQERHGIKISRETLRKWQIEGSNRKPRFRKAMKAYQMRERRSRYGELVQIDGSHHDWFEGRAEKCCLLVFVDDATGKIMQLHFDAGETTEGYFQALKEYIVKHGLPLAFYSDKDSIFRVNREENEEEYQTQFSRALNDLGIELICAHSPQAKGRVERMNGTLQDRLIKEMRINNINDIKTANAFLPGFIEAYNKRFAVESKSEVNAHRKEIPTLEALELILSFHEHRTLSKNLEISYKNLIYQIQTTGNGYTMRHAKVLVCESLEGKVTLFYKGRVLSYKTYKKQKRAIEVIASKLLNSEIDRIVKTVNINKPKSDHPWKRFNVGWLKNEKDNRENNYAMLNN